MEYHNKMNYKIIFKIYMDKAFALNATGVSTMFQLVPKLFVTTNREKWVGSLPENCHCHNH